MDKKELKKLFDYLIEETNNLVRDLIKDGETYNFYSDYIEGVADTLGNIAYYHGIDCCFNIYYYEDDVDDKFKLRIRGEGELFDPHF